MTDEQRDEPSTAAVIVQIVGAVIVVSLGIAALGPVFAEATSAVGHVIKALLVGIALAFWLTDLFEEPWGRISQFQPRPHRRRQAQNARAPRRHRSLPDGSAQRRRR